MFSQTSLRQRGFTLVELMVAVAIIGILAAIALPSYSAYIVRSNRAAAQSYLMELSQAQAQFMADTRTYAATVDDLNLLPPDGVAAKYTIAIAVEQGPPQSYVITATPVEGTAQAEDGELSINQAGIRTPGDKW
jgi:type IV pilus assembly protein PilE